MSILLRVLLAGACIAAGASSAQAQTLGTYLPGEIYPFYEPYVVPVAPSTNVLGAGPVVVRPSLTAEPPALGPRDLARAFALADVDHDGDLTQAEARRIGIGTEAFNEMDRNNDGVLTRSELEDGLR
jgi:hypothetical protein